MRGAFSLTIHGTLDNNKKVKSALMLVATGVLWSFGGVFIKLVNWNPFAIAGSRSAIAALIMLLYIRKSKIKDFLCKSKKPAGGEIADLPASSNARAFKEYLKNLTAVQILGAVFYAATVISFVAANKLTTAANAILLQYTAPIYILIFGAWFLNEKATMVDWISVFFTFAGMILFFLDDLSRGNLWGNLLAIFSGVTFSVMVMLFRKQKEGSPIESAFLGNIVTAIAAIPFMFQSVPKDVGSWIGILFLGVLQLGISYILYSEAIKHVSALEASLIPIIEPILNPVWVFIGDGEVPGPWSIVGGIVVLVSVTGKFAYLAMKAGNSNHREISAN